MEDITSNRTGSLSIEKGALLDACLTMPLGRMFSGLRSVQDLPIGADKPETFILDGAQLADLRIHYLHGHPRVRQAVDALLRRTTRHLDHPLPTVTAKQFVPPSGDLHSYTSLAKYYWPDEEGSFTRRDGFINPSCYDNTRYDYQRLVDFSEHLTELALASYLTQDQGLSQRAAAMLATWFIDTDTKQHPHFVNAQLIPGKSDGRPEGLIEARHLIYVTEAVSLLEAIPSFPTSVADGVRSWFGAFLEWLTTSEQGQTAKHRANNIAFWYQAQVLSYASFVGDQSRVITAIYDEVIPQVEQQIGRDGELSAELDRARPHDYVAFTVLAMALIDSVAEKSGHPLWDTRVGDGKSLQAAHDWLLRSTHGTELAAEAIAAAAGSHHPGQNSTNHDTSLARLHDELALRDLALESRIWRRRNEATSGELTELKEEHRRTSDRLHAMKDALDSSHWEQRGAALRAERAEQALVEVLQRADAFESELLDVRQSLEEERQRAARLEHEGEALRLQVKTWCDHVTVLERRLVAVAGSTSWRVTGPLRVASRFVKRILTGRATPKLAIPPRPAVSKVEPTVKQTSRDEGPSLPPLPPWILQGLYLDKVQRPRTPRHLHRKAQIGFHAAAARDLEALAVAESADEETRLAASWELVLWYGREGSDATPQALVHAKKLEGRTFDWLHPQRLAVMVSELHLREGEWESAHYSVMKAISQHPTSPDLLLAAARLYRSDDAPAESQGHLDEITLYWINRLLTDHGLEGVERRDANLPLTIDNLTTSFDEDGQVDADQLVTVIVPAHNAAHFLATSVSSLRQQSWRNLEILIVDDASTDQTVEVAQSLAREDERIRFLQSPRNGGPYAARNLGLRVARGTYVTVQDADDWAHLRRIETQARHLERHPEAVGNEIGHVRTTPGLEPQRRGNPGAYLFSCLTSLMFRRREVIERAGRWDEVRFAGDSEYKKRLKAIFGEQAIVELQTPPLAIFRTHAASITATATTGYPGFKMGARQEYDEASAHWRASNRSRKNPFHLKIGMEASRRPFPVPNILRSGDRSTRHFDVVIGTDLRSPGGTTHSTLQEVRIQQQLGLRTGLVHLPRYDANPFGSINPAVREVLDERTSLCVYGEQITCDLFLIRFPGVLEEYNEHWPSIEAKSIRIIVNQTPLQSYGAGARRYHGFASVDDNVRKAFRATPTWHPIGPVIRETLLTRHADEIADVALSDEDWVNVVDLPDWLRAPHVPTAPFAIGRHSRDSALKWPADPELLRQTYPNHEDCTVRVLGGAKTPERILGKLPSNWHVWEFNGMKPKEFLAGLDAYVYFTHPEWVESFGRCVLEAMATGVPTILPPEFEPTFGEAGIYCRPDEVLERIRDLCSDPERYQTHVRTMLQHIEDRFGAARHADRVATAISPQQAQENRESAPKTHTLLAGAQRPGGIPLATLSWESLEHHRCDAPDNMTDPLRSALEVLTSRAEGAMQRAAPTVTAKTTLPPSGNVHDYWHPAPYWWPNPDTPDGLPYVHRDGERVPGTRHFERGSEQYDRSSVQRLFDDSFTLALAAALSGDRRYADRVVELLEVFFIRPETAMSPHLTFAQVKRGHRGDRGSPSGIIEFKDLYFYLDAIKLVDHVAPLEPDVRLRFESWLRAYLDWLEKSAQGTAECQAANNHGTFYDLQVGAISLFIGDRRRVEATVDRARRRAEKQFDTSGRQPEELGRTTSAHYCLFNYQGWRHLDGLARTVGQSLIVSSDSTSQRLLAGARWLASNFGKNWPFLQIEPFDTDRFIPALWGLDVAPIVESHWKTTAAHKPVFDPDAGVRPFWPVGVPWPHAT